MRIFPRLIGRLRFSAPAAVALMVVAEAVARADQSCVLRAATAEEQKFYADAYARFQKIAPPAPAGWTATDTIPGGASNGVATQVCAAPGQPVFYASFARSYSLAAQEVFAREAELGRKLSALMAENNAAMKTGKPVDWDAFEAAKKKLGGEAERDTTAELRVLVGHDAPNVVAPSPRFRCQPAKATAKCSRLNTVCCTRICSSCSTRPRRRRVLRRSS